MKANVQLEIDKEDLSYELKELVSELASREIERMVKEVAKKMVDEEVTRIVAPIVDSYLESALVGREYNYHEKNITKRPVDDYIKQVLERYLDQPVYDYSQTANELSKKYMPSSAGGEKKTRAEQWVTEKAKKYADTELFSRLDEQMKEIGTRLIPSEDRIQEIIQAELKKLISGN